MAFTDDQIRDYALQLEAKGAAPAEIEAFVAGAKGEQPAKPAAPKPAQEDSPYWAVNRLTDQGRDAASGVRRMTMNDVANMGVRAGGPAIGQGIGAATGPLAPAAVPILGAIGGMAGEAIAQSREGTFPRWGAIFGAAPMGAIPGGNLAKAGAGALAKQGILAAGANVAGKEIETIVDQGRPASMGEVGGSALGGAASPFLGKALDKGTQAAGIAAAKSRNASFDAIRKETINEGWVIPPPALQNEMPGAVADMANVGGSTTKVFAEASKRNQTVTNAAVRKYAGLSPNTNLGPDEFKAAIKAAERPYEAVAAISPQAKLSLDGLKDARVEAKKFWKAYERDLDPKKLDQAKEYDLLADSFHNDLKAEAKAAGKSELVDKMDAARIELAKLHFADWATSESGNASAKAFGLAKDAGVPLTGDGLKIANAYNTFKPAFRDIAGLGGSVVGEKISPIQSILAKFQLSPLRQFSNTPYSMPRPDMAAQMARFSSAGLGRTGNPFLQPVPLSTDQTPNNPFLQQR